MAEICRTPQRTRSTLQPLNDERINERMINYTPSNSLEFDRCYLEVT
jgi:hypothetical protein